MDRAIKLLAAPPREFFCFGMRWAFGFWMLYLGLSKWVLFGPSGFVGFITKEFAQAWPPEVLVVPLAYIILVAEPLLGLWLISGIKQRLAWVANAKLLFLLVIGKTIVMDFGTVANNWQYFVLAVAMAALSSAEEVES